MECLLVYVDGQELGDQDVAGLYRWLWLKIRDAAEATAILLANHPPEDVGSYEDFKNALIAALPDGLRIVLLIDEFERLVTNPLLDRTFFDQLRSLNGDQACNVAYATVSYSPLHDLAYLEQSVLSSPFFNIFHSLPLSFLESDEAEEAVRRPAEMVGAGEILTSRDLEFIFDVAGFHPFFLQLACYCLFDRKRKIEQEHRWFDADYEQVRHQYADDVERFFEYTWKGLNAAVREALWLISEGEAYRVRSDELDKLKALCLIYKDALFSSVFGEFIRQKMVPAAGPRTVEEVSRCHLDVFFSKGGDCAVRVTGAQTYLGESRMTFDQHQVEQMEKDLVHAVQSSSWRFEAQQVGRDIYRSFFGDPSIRAGYNRAVDRCTDVRTHLSFSAPRRYLSFPFEALFDGKKYLCLRHPISRIITGAVAEQQPLSAGFVRRLRAQGEPLRILLVASDAQGPHGKRMLGVDSELERLHSLLSNYQCDVAMLRSSEATCDVVRRLLEEGRYHLVHYIGHASYDPASPETSSLYFWQECNAKGDVVPLRAYELSSLVQREPPRFVYLSCYQTDLRRDPDVREDNFLGVIDGLVNGGVPAILGLRWRVSREGIQTLAHGFYRALFEEEVETLDEALLVARWEVVNTLGRESRAWLSPILVMPPF